MTAEEILTNKLRNYFEVLNNTPEEVKKEVSDMLDGLEREPKDVVLGYKTSLDAQMLEQIDQTNPVTRGSTALVFKQETPEETAFRLFPRLINDPYNPMEDDNKEYRDIWISGAKWMQERMYSEEEVLNLLKKAHFVEQNIEEWFKQFKK